MIKGDAAFLHILKRLQQLKNLAPKCCQQSHVVLRIIFMVPRFLETFLETRCSLSEPRSFWHLWSFLGCVTQLISWWSNTTKNLDGKAFLHPLIAINSPSLQGTYFIWLSVFPFVVNFCLLIKAVLSLIRNEQSFTISSWCSPEETPHYPALFVFLTLSTQFVHRLARTVGRHCRLCQ